MRRRSEPTPQQIASTPELAILCALDELIEIACRALIAAHPVLGDSDAPYWVRESCRLATAAATLIEAAEPLHRAIQAYAAGARAEGSNHGEDDIDLPF